MRKSNGDIEESLSGFRVVKPVPLRVLIARYVRWCVRLHGHNQARTARVLKCSPRTVFKYFHEKGGVEYWKILKELKEGKD